MVSEQQFRDLARVGALAMCRRAVSEFPDILADLNALASGNGHDAGEAPRRGRPPMSAAARAKISRAMKRRWRKQQQADA